MPFHKPRIYVLAMPPATEAKRRGLDAAFGESQAERFWTAWHRDLLPPLFAADDLDVRLAFGPQKALPYYKDLVRTPGQLCFFRAKDLPQRWMRMLEVGISAADKTIVVTSDVPALSVDLLRDVLADLDRHDMVVGQERDERFWLVGLAKWNPHLFEHDFDSGPPLAGFTQHAESLGFRVKVDYSHQDLNSPDDVRALPAAVDAERFPQTLAALKEIGIAA